MSNEHAFESILQRMLSRVSNEVDKREGSVIYNTLAPVAAELAQVYIEHSLLEDRTYADTAIDEDLTRRAAERGVIRYPATKAVRKGIFKGRDNAPFNPPIGSRFSGGNLYYVVKEKIAEGEFRLECEAAGASGNTYFGPLLPIDYIDGLVSAEISDVLLPGEDAESDESLRARYFESLESKAFGGNIADYKAKTNSIPGVGGTKVFPVWNAGISPAAMVPTEGVVNWYNSIIGTLPQDVADWLSAVFTAALERKLTTGGAVKLVIIDSEYNVPSPELIDYVQEIIDPEQNHGEGFGLAPIGHVVTVEGVTGVEVNIQTCLTYEPGYVWDDVKANVIAAIEGYLAELRSEWEEKKGLLVRISHIETRILDVKGILDVQYTKINQSTQNLVLDETEIPVLGEVTVI